MTDHDDDFYEDDELLACFRCDGAGAVPCHCGGDLCVCGDQEVACQGCGGDGHVTQAKYDRQVAAYRKIMKAIWGDQND